MDKDFSRILEQLEKDFREFSFEPAERSRWSWTEHKIYFRENLPELFHELGHAKLNHKKFVQDIDLVKMERDAWTFAKNLAPKYGVEIRENDIESALDDYRDWLHARSLCPNCAQTGLQSRETLTYKCLNCGAKWTANDARKVGLKRRRAE
jgi:ribosomal protein L37AE/L43A